MCIWKSQSASFLWMGADVLVSLAYDRELGRFKVFKAKAVVMATGGIGRAFLVTSNSWEYTGDGHALAYEAGAELVDMEFVQFHPTGMVWPPSVRGILVTEGVRGEGGILKNSEGRRFMFDDIPPLYKESTADTPEEGWRYVIGDREARRPPELLTRDHVARKIVKEVQEGRGSPHGGAFLDIAWIQEHIKDSEDHIKKKLPSMYHQFKELAGIELPKSLWRLGQLHTMRWGVFEWTRIPRCRQPYQVFSQQGMCSWTARGEPIGRQFALGFTRIREAGWGIRCRVLCWKHAGSSSGRTD
ncbi:MAG: hypothetical protein CM1200mP14_10210 [Gammaproteobacteria bacterium]|nr:MAG: hypothetical protein CM1200mP14_10210 [Gammaproteobacteria bacterium]